MSRIYVLTCESGDKCEHARLSWLLPHPARAWAEQCNANADAKCGPHEVAIEEFDDEEITP